MRIRVIGAGWYGCHVTLSLLKCGHSVEIWEKTGRVFSGASGNMPGRLHYGFHYPRSKLTRVASQKHRQEFKDVYGEFVRDVKFNVYAIAKHDSLLDYGTYIQIMSAEEWVADLPRPSDHGIDNVEGALWTMEQYVNLEAAAKYFQRELGSVIQERIAVAADDLSWDLTIDTSFCALDNVNVDRYEACVTVLLEGPIDKSITIMDGPFSSLYVFDDELGLSSLSSAKYTPICKTKTWNEARHFLDTLSSSDVRMQGDAMYDQMAHYYPRLTDDYRIVDHRLAIRAMPRSAADARLVDVVRVGDRALRVRAGKLDAVFHAERAIKRLLPEFVRA